MLERSELQAIVLLKNNITSFYLWVKGLFYVMMNMTRNINGAGVILLDSGNRILLVLGREHGKWSFPKGMLDGDSPRVCAVRETKEETGLDVKINPDTPKWVCNDYVFYLLQATDVIGSWRLHPNDREEIEVATWMTVREVLELPDECCNNVLRNFKRKRK